MVGIVFMTTAFVLERRPLRQRLVRPGRVRRKGRSTIDRAEVLIFVCRLLANNAEV
jgi:hypothetical protein